ncbi:MAG: D-glycerate dehydrogenase [Candidatus Blackburnbacteria bacterium]|nr:D-glycerate dehydrogenase [Candidatus Blackburnbacteria bacterium]
MKVLVTRKIPGDHLKRLEGHEVAISPFNRPLAPQEIIEMGKGADAVITLLTDRWTGELMDKFPNLKIISNYAVGFDNIDLKAATERGIVVTNTPSTQVNEGVAEFTWALILALSRRVVEADEYARKGAYHGWEPDIFLGRDVYGKTLGIVGLGRIGSMVARRAKGFNMSVVYHNRSRDEKTETELGVKYLDLDPLLRLSDYVTLHVPLTKETTHLINAEKLALMKPTAYLINTARGAVVDEHALAEALREGKILGAALDVHENEPQMNPELMQMENVILTPHIASGTVEVREKMCQQAVDSVLAVLSGQKPENIVNEEVWPSVKAQSQSIGTTGLVVGSE